MINIYDYFSLNRILLLAIGLWPYQKSKFAQFYSICCFSILITCIIFQFSTFVTSKCTVDLVLKILSPTSVFTGAAIMYNSFYINNETVKSLMEQLHHVYGNLRNNNEIAIVERYGNYAKRYTAVLTMVIIFATSFVIGVQLYNRFNFRNVILSTKEPQPRHLILRIEYFVNEEKYFYLLQLHINAAICIITITLVSTGAMFIAYCQLVCGLFQIASYRIEQAIQIYTVRGIILLNENMIYKRIVCAVDIHRKAIMFSEHLLSRFEKTFLLLIICGVVSLSLNIYCIFQSMSWKYAKDLVFSLILACSTILYMFLANLIGQQIIDHNNHVFMTAYKIQWYLTPIRIQKMILFLLQRGNKVYGLNLGGLFMASMECFATLVNASISYFTVIYSVE
ncbi:odorant receptor 49b-like isoform X1 [Linepithema humile]|uniref:odorant receptor 49b-like isoform X1 n=1 Tax=Linepithema humile TaxID=83485 RepID=UPI00351DB543